MRLHLLPISTRRTLLYCQKLNVATPQQPQQQQSLAEKLQDRVARTWATWEKQEKGMQKKIVTYGNQLFKRIPYEEWGLKSVPPLSARRQNEEMTGKDAVEVVFPASVIPAERVPTILQTLATEREAFHRQRMTWCFIGMPFTIPVAILPVIPNLPFFYLAYRAWSHWRALQGGKHIQFLLQNKLLTLAPSPILDLVYSKPQTQSLPSSPAPTVAPAAAQLINPATKNQAASPEAESHPDGETLLLTQERGRQLAEAIDVPPLEVELERAIWQVETAIGKQNEERASAAGGGAAKASGSSTASSEDKKSQ